MFMIIANIMGFDGTLTNTKWVLIENLMAKMLFMVCSM